MPRILVFALVVTIVLTVACGGDNETPEPTPPAVVTQLPTAASTPSPGETPAAHVPNVAPSSDIKLPAGFAAYPIATGFLRATSVAPAPGGAIYVSDRNGNVYRLVDANGDGVFEGNSLFTFGARTITGIMVAPDGTLYVASTGKISTVRDTNGDGSSDAVKDIISGLPTGRHQNNGMAIGPDGKLYITNGSTCDDCLEKDERSATIMQSNLDGSGLRVYAKGLRNPYDIVFDSNGQLWSTDNGSDAPCATIDELNLIVDGGDYGWPYGNDGCDPQTDGTPPVASLGLHAAATGITSYNSTQFPAEYNVNLFATDWGSLFAKPDPYDRVLLSVNLRAGFPPPGRSSAVVEVFGSGFKHPIDVFADSDGSLLVLDYGSDDANAKNGTLYRIVYTGQ
jgi:glucose/arabinose dehydrogenase